MYGARWLYKLGLGLLVDGDESIAHVRTQVIDYGSICEACSTMPFSTASRQTLWPGPLTRPPTASRAGRRLTGTRASRPTRSTDATLSSLSRWRRTKLS